VRALLQDVEGGFNIEYADPTNRTPRRLSAAEGAAQSRVKINVVEVDGVHRTLPHVRHIAEETKGLDKVRVRLAPLLAVRCCCEACGSW
jgi:hypothetical protein